MSSVQGRVVVVTGAFGALGSAVARKLRASGVTVALLGRAPGSAALAAEFAAPHVVLSGVDLASIEEASRGFGVVVAGTPEIDAPINVAGGFRWERLGGGDVGTGDSMFSCNFR